MLEDEARIGYQPRRTPLNNVTSFLERRQRLAPLSLALTWLPAATRAAWFDDPGVELAHESLSAEELTTRTAAVASGLTRLGLRHGDRAFLFIPMSTELYLAMFAVEWLGASAVFLDSWARRGQLADCAAQTEPRALIGPEPAFALASDIPSLAGAPIRVVVGPHVGRYSARLEELAAEPTRVPMAAVEQEETALITFTTGSSGRPKGADRTHRFLASQAEALGRCLSYAPGDVDLPVFPIFALNDIATGVEAVIPAVDLARPAATDGALLAAQMRAAGVTSTTLSPSLLRALAISVREAGSPLAGLRQVVTGGAPVSRDDIAAIDLAAPGAALHILFGSTEVEPIAHAVASELPTAAGDDAGVCVGRIDSGLAFKFLALERGPLVLDGRGWAPLECRTGELGELAVSGEHVCRGYFRNPEAFARAKIVDAEGRIWHRTGDVGRLDAEARLWLAGRVHNAIRRAGRTLFPVAAEVAMRRVPGVREAAYVGLPDAALTERAVAAFERDPARAGADLVPSVRAALAAAGLPADDVIEVAAIPLDPRHRSKVEYDTLRAELAARAGTAP